MNAEANDIKNKAQELCDKLCLAAKESATRRFHALYDKVYRIDILREAWEQVKVNKGSPGIDNESIEDIVQKGEDTVLREIQQNLMNGEYRPRSVKRVYIPKPDGSKRGLGIPSVRDRIVQGAAKRVLEPIFEADFLDCSFGFRPGRSAHEALEEIRKATNAGHRFVLDADIRGFFDNIDHAKLMELLHRRISDRRMLKLIRKWLECGVMDGGGLLDTKIGTPQGGVISPLLANIFLHDFDKYWDEQSIVKGKLVRYADDFVILFKTKVQAELGMQLVTSKLKELGLELNQDKTKLVDMTEGKEGFDFLGFHHRRVKSYKYKRYYTQKWPSVKAMNNIRVKIRDFLGRRSTLPWSLENVVKKLNPILRGWMNYFRFGNSAKKFAQIDEYVRERLALWWSKKHGKSGRRWTTGFSYAKYKHCGVQVLSGNIVYWSRLPRA